MLKYIEEIDLDKKVHFIGIGGSSMSGLAKILKKMGYAVSGSDMNMSATTEYLESLGIEIYNGHSATNVEGKDVVVYTNAINEENPEFKYAYDNNLETYSRAELLGFIMKNFSKSIAVSGTHGKTSTTSMIASILMEANVSPTIHVGATLDLIGGNTHLGDSEYFVTEACEYCDSFLKLYPEVAVILNIELDHIDYFKNIERVKKSFSSFIDNVPDDGFIVAFKDDANVREVIEKTTKKVITFSINDRTADWQARELSFSEEGKASYALYHKDDYITDIDLPALGTHNVLNSLAAIASCQALGCDIKDVKAGIKNYYRPQRRFEIKGDIEGIKVVDDYAHHPTEIKATLAAARKSCKGKVWCVFQPHTYSRTKYLLNDFAASFENADEVIVSDIYAAREQNNNEIHSRDLAEKIKENNKDAIYIDSFEKIAEYIKGNIQKDDIVIVMGAGDINKVCTLLLK